MPVYPLIEYKLRRYLYLGHEYCIYVPPPIRATFWNQKHHDDITGVRVIGKIVKRNKPEEINSIVPILLKIKKEGKLLDDRLLIYALAVCAKLNLKQCTKMVTDAYAAVMAICTDGLKLLMFVKFCTTASRILNEQGLLTIMSHGFGRGFAKAMTKWYLDRDPLLTTEHIVRNKSYDGWSHKNVMKLIHLHSAEPCRIMYIAYTLVGMSKVEQQFGTQMKDVCIEDVDETFENKQLKFIYNFLNQVEAVKTMDERALKCEIELNRWGNEPEIIPLQMLKSSTILTSLIMHLPLKTILDNTFFYAKHRVFCNLTPDVGLWEYISRFNNTVLLRKSQIHPIESFIQYVKYARTSIHIMDLQNNILKKEDAIIVDTIDKKLKIFVDLQKTSDKDEAVFLPTVENEGELFNEETQTHNSNDQNCNAASTSTQNTEDQKSKRKSTKGENTKSKHGENSLENPSVKEHEKTESANSSSLMHRISTLNTNSQPINSESTAEDVIQSEANNVNQNQESVMILIRQPPKLVNKMLTFLSEDLIKKTCDILTPSGLRIMIVYDSRECMKQSMCACTRLLKVHEAITLITLSLIYPEKLENKPTVFGLDSTSKTCKEVEIDYTQPLTVASLESVLFKTPVITSESIALEAANNKRISEVFPQFAVNWALENNKEFDLFVFMGTNKLFLKNIKYYIKKYQETFQKRVKVVICCLNGKHYDQISVGGGSMLVVIGFDKHVGKLINSYIKEDF